MQNNYLFNYPRTFLICLPIIEEIYMKKKDEIDSILSNEEIWAQFKSSVEIQSQLLAKYSTYTIQEEWNISYAVQLCSEAFYLRVQ